MIMKKVTVSGILADFSKKIKQLEDLATNMAAREGTLAHERQRIEIEAAECRSERIKALKAAERIAAMTGE